MKLYIHISLSVLFSCKFISENVYFMYMNVRMKLGVLYIYIYMRDSFCVCACMLSFWACLFYRRFYQVVLFYIILLFWISLYLFALSRDKANPDKKGNIKRKVNSYSVNCCLTKTNKITKENNKWIKVTSLEWYIIIRILSWRAIISPVISFYFIICKMV